MEYLMRCWIWILWIWVRVLRDGGLASSDASPTATNLKHELERFPVLVMARRHRQDQRSVVMAILEGIFQALLKACIKKASHDDPPQPRPQHMQGHQTSQAQGHP